MNIIISNTVKGILLITGGIIVLLDALGIARQLFHICILLGAFLMIISGIYLADLHKKVYFLLKNIIHSAKE